MQDRKKGVPDRIGEHKLILRLVVYPGWKGRLERRRRRRMTSVQRGGESSGFIKLRNWERVLSRPLTHIRLIPSSTHHSSKSPKRCTRSSYLPRWPQLDRGCCTRWSQKLQRRTGADSIGVGIILRTRALKTYREIFQSGMPRRAKGSEVGLTLFIAKVRGLGRALEGVLSLISVLP